MENIVEVKNLKKYFTIGGGGFRKKYFIKAVDNISFNIKKKEILGLVGESGCGKTTCGKIILRIIDPSSGSIVFDGHDITSISQRKMTRFRNQMMIIYQDPYGSLDPRMKIGSTIAEPMEVHHMFSKEEKEQKENRIMELMEKLAEMEKRLA